MVLSVSSDKYNVYDTKLQKTAILAKYPAVVVFTSKAACRLRRISYIIMLEKLVVFAY